MRVNASPGESALPVQRVSPPSVLCRVFEVHGLRGLARHKVQLLIARYGDVLAAAGIGLREPLHPVAARAAGGQQEYKGKSEKGRKDIRFSVHRLTAFLSLLIELRMSLCYLRDQ